MAALPPCCTQMVGKIHNSRGTPDDNKTLRQLGFQIGDFLDVAILRGP